MSDRRRYRSFITDSARWGRYEPRAGDIVVTTPPKGGTTWMQMCCALLVHGRELPARLSVLSPWLDQTLAPIEAITERLDQQQHRRIIKTHTPLDGLRLYDEVTYIVVGRDPRDIALSFANHLANFNLEVATAARGESGEGAGPQFPDRPTDPVGLFTYFVDDPSPVESFTTSLDFVLHHLGEGWRRRDEPNVELFHYGAMRRDLAGELRRLADRLGIEVDPSTWPELVHAASFESMRARADEVAPNADRGLWKDNRQFFAEGRHGSWREVVPAAELARYDELIAARCDPAFAAWLHT